MSSMAATTTTAATDVTDEKAPGSTTTPKWVGSPGEKLLARIEVIVDAAGAAAGAQECPESSSSPVDVGAGGLKHEYSVTKRTVVIGRDSSSQQPDIVVEATTPFIYLF